MFRLFFEFGPLLVWTVLLFTFVRPLQLGRAGSCALGLFLLAASQKFLIYKYFGGDSFVPDLPERFVNLTGWTYSSCMMLFGGSSVWWLFRAFQRRWRRWRRHAETEARDLKLDRVVLLVGSAVAVVLAGWGIWEGVRVPRVKEVQLAVRHLPKAFDGFRLVHLSDLHCSSAARRARTAGIVEAVNGLHADLVCITGDFVDGSPEQRRGDLSPLRDLKAAHGVVACSGNHEYYHDYALWRHEFAALGIRMLDNSHEVLARNGERLVVGGVTDFAAANNDQRLMEGPDIDQAFLGAPLGTARILLQHRPIGFAFYAELGVDLQLSGHTHGGAVFGLDQLVKWANENHVRGLYELPNGAKLYVCPGTGQWAGFPLRLGVPAEITVLVLRAK